MFEEPVLLHVLVDFVCAFLFELFVVTAEDLDLLTSEPVNVVEQRKFVCSLVQVFWIVQTK